MRFLAAAEVERAAVEERRRALEESLYPRERVVVPKERVEQFFSRLSEDAWRRTQRRHGRGRLLNGMCWGACRAVQASGLGLAAGRPRQPGWLLNVAAACREAIASSAKQEEAAKLESTKPQRGWGVRSR